MNDQLKALAEPFDKSVESTMTKGGAALTYIPVSEVIYRLNQVLHYNWSYTVHSCQRDPLDPDYIVAHVTMKIYAIDGTIPMSERDGFGGVKVKRTKTGDIVDLGDEYKGAVSDALKKAAQAFGVGLYLARHEDKPLAPSNPTPSAIKGIKANLSPVRNVDDPVQVKGTQHGDLPEWLLNEAFKEGITQVWDNRDKVAGTKRPWFKDVNGEKAFWPPRGTPDPVITTTEQVWDTEEEPF